MKICALIEIIEVKLWKCKFEDTAKKFYLFGGKKNRPKHESGLLKNYYVLSI
jgi:hypothetical protein